MRVLIHDSHSGGGGAPGERDYIVGFFNPELVRQLALRGIEAVRVPGDGKRHPAFLEDYGAFVAPHYDADIYTTPPNGAPPHEGGWLWDRAAASLSAAEDDRLGAIIERRYKALEGEPPFRPGRRNANTRDYYGFRYTTAKTPGVIVELGVGAPVCNGHGQPKAPDHDWLRANVPQLAALMADSLAEFGGVVDPARIVLGPTRASLGQMRAFLARENPAAAAWVPELYLQHAAGAGIRAEIALAQAIKETGYFRFPGTAKAEWHNPAGLGVTGSPDVGNRFPTWDAGIRAHYGHLLNYFGDHKPEFCDVDQRHFGAGWVIARDRRPTPPADATGHLHLPNDVTELSQRWAAPGLTYGEDVAAIAEAILATSPEAEPSLWDERPDDTPATLGEVRRYARALADQPHANIGKGGH